MLLLLLSFVALWVGPAILMASHPTHRMMVWVDRIVIVSILLLVILHVIPESYEQAGWYAIAAILIGAIWPLIYQKVSRSDNCYLQKSLLSLASVGLITHMMLDGAALADDVYLASAVILHRLPEGLAIWRMAQTLSGGRKWGYITLIVMMIATMIGFVFGSAWLYSAPETVIGLFEGLMAGVLLHVVFHQTHVQHTEDEHE